MKIMMSVVDGIPEILFGLVYVILPWTRSSPTRPFKIAWTFCGIVWLCLGGTTLIVKVCFSHMLVMKAVLGELIKILLGMTIGANIITVWLQWSCRKEMRSSGPGASRCYRPN